MAVPLCIVALEVRKRSRPNPGPPLERAPSGPAARCIASRCVPRLVGRLAVRQARGRATVALAQRRSARQAEPATPLGRQGAARSAGERFAAPASDAGRTEHRSPFPRPALTRWPFSFSGLRERGCSGLMHSRPDSPSSRFWDVQDHNESNDTALRLPVSAHHQAGQSVPVSSTGPLARPPKPDSAACAMQLREIDHVPSPRLVASRLT